MVFAMPLSHVHSYSIFARHQIICSNPIIVVVIFTPSEEKSDEFLIKADLVNSNLNAEHPGYRW